MKRSNEEHYKKCEEHEQYGQRLCLTIKSLTKKNEDAIDVLNQLHDLFKEAEVDAVSLMPFWIGAQS